MARSYANLLDLAAGDAPLFTRPMQPPQPRSSSGSRAPMTRSATAAAALSEGAGAGRDDVNSVASDTPSSLAQERLIVVANMLPLHAEKDPLTQWWKFRWDEDALLLQMKDGIVTPEREDCEILYVGSLKVEIEVSEQDRVAAHLLDKFNCVPTFLSADLQNRFYQGFCKQQLWPLFHYMLPLSPQHGGLFSRDLWQAYVAANKIFSDKVMEVISPEDDFVWVHDYHLMVLPTFLRKKFNRVRLGFFLHSPFPSSEIFRTLPVREEILRALLNADLVGFHTFDYARHFLSCCSRMLGLEYESRRGYIGLDYYGRTVGIKIMPVGVDVGRLEAGLRLPDTEWRLGELRAEYAGKAVMLGVDDMDIFKGLGLKLQAFESMLAQHPEWVGRAVLVQITNPARGKGRDTVDTQDEVHALVERINGEFGREGYVPVVLLQRHVPLYERIAFYVVAESLVLTAVRDGMNLTPYEYIICRQGLAEAQTQHPHSPLLLPAEGTPGQERQQLGPGGTGDGTGSMSTTTPASATSSGPGLPSTPPLLDVGTPGVPAASAPPTPTSSLLVGALPSLPPVRTGRGREGSVRQRSTIVVSEFVGCSPSLSGAMRVNPWNVQAVADAMNSALTMPLAEQEMRHEKHFKYVRDHNVCYWAQSFLADLQRTCREHSRLRCYGIGFGLGFRTVALDPNFRKLQPDLIARAYQRARNRLLLLDYDGTMMPQASLNKTPNGDVLAVLSGLCSDPRNVVFVVSSRTRAVLAEWFAQCPKLGLAAEQGYFYRLCASSPWHTILSPQASSSSSSSDGGGGGGGGSSEGVGGAGDPPGGVGLMSWKEAALPVLELYTESTDGSYVEEKESAVVWHHRDADPDFGSWQAKELLDHLESVLANEPVTVRSGHHIVEVKPQGVSKGLVLDQLLDLISHSSTADTTTPPTITANTVASSSSSSGGTSAAPATSSNNLGSKVPPRSKAGGISSGALRGWPDFVLCVGDDRSDEDMFEKLESIFSGASSRRGVRDGPAERSAAAEVFACTVGQKPSKAKYYLDDTSEVLKLLRTLAETSAAGGRGGPGLLPLAPASNGVGTEGLLAPAPVPPPDLSAGLLPSSLAAVLPSSTLQAVTGPPRQAPPSDSSSSLQGGSQSNSSS